MKEVIILGTGMTNIICPFDKEVWGCNAAYQLYIRTTRRLRVDKLFFFDDLTKELPTSPMCIERLKKVTIPLISVHQYEGLTIEPYPLDEIIECFDSTYFSNTIAYMIAYAMYLDYEAIDFYGIDHISEDSYMLERAGVEYWVGRAKERGIKIFIPDGSILCKTFDGTMYGSNRAQMREFSRT